MAFGEPRRGGVRVIGTGRCADGVTVPTMRALRSKRDELVLKVEVVPHANLNALPEVRARFDVCETDCVI